METLNLTGFVETNQMRVENFIASSAAVLGMTNSGKSNSVAVLAEEFLIQGLPFVLVDYAGEYWGLKEMFDIYSVGRSVKPDMLDATISPVSAAKCAKNSYLNATSFILDVSDYDPESRMEFLAIFLNKLWQLALVNQYPYSIILEEAHNFIPEKGKTEVSGILTTIALEGRKRGLGIILASQRTAMVSKNILTQAQIYILHKVFFETDLRVYRTLIPGWTAKETSGKITSLKPGDAYVLWSDNIQRHRIRKRFTTRGGDTPTLADLPDVRGITSPDDLVK